MLTLVWVSSLRREEKKDRRGDSLDVRDVVVDGAVEAVECLKSGILELRAARLGVCLFCLIVIVIECL